MLSKTAIMALVLVVILGESVRGSNRIIKLL